MPLPDGFLHQFPAEIFIETGSHRGDGIQSALDAGFECIYSVDIAPFSYGWCSHRFKDDRVRVRLFCGDSVGFLERLLHPLNEAVGSPAVFWLDAHWCGGDGEMEGRDEMFKSSGKPLLAELEVIAKHRIKNHTLLIDDVRMMGVDESFPSLDEVTAALEKVNPEYRLRVDGDILVAFL